MFWLLSFGLRSYGKVLKSGVDCDNMSSGISILSIKIIENRKSDKMGAIGLFSEFDPKQKKCQNRVGSQIKKRILK